MKNSTQQTALMLLAVAIIVGGAAFFGGIQYQKRLPTQFAAGARGGRGGGQFAGAGAAGQAGVNQRFGGGANRPVLGDIISSDDKSITVKMADGSTKIVLLSETTTINKASDATKADLKVGEKVSVFGSQNAEGSVTAQNIQLNPMMRMFGNGGATPSASPKVQN